MRVFGLNEQDPAALRIREAAGRNMMPHALILSGAGDRVAAARFAAAAYQCTAEQERPCGVCSGCRKVLADIHPDVIFVRDSEHKILPVELMRATRADAHIMPNEGARKVYIFEDCAQLDDRCQDIMLKTVEEGPAYAAFLFCAENSASLLPTLRSRCVELKLRPEEEQVSDSDPRAVELCEVIAGGKHTALVRFLTGLEGSKVKREELREILEEARMLFAAAALRLYGCESRENEREIAVKLTENLTKSQIMRTIEVLQNYCSECEWNVGPGHVLGALAVELEGIL